MSLLAACLSLAGCTIKALSRAFFIAPLFILGSGDHLEAFGLEQLHALGLLLVRVHDLGALGKYWRIFPSLSRRYLPKFQLGREPLLPRKA